VIRAAGVTVVAGLVAVSLGMAGPALLAEAQAAPERPQAAPTTTKPATRKPTSRPTSRPTRVAPPAPTVNCEPRRGQPKVTGESWAHKRLGLQRAWELSQGRGVTVAVIDSGADTGHPMLAGRISEFIDRSGTGERDCVGHGTGVAAIIGGRDLSTRGIDLSGVAPAAKLLIVKNQNAESEEAGGDRLPSSIRAAVDNGADVINISIRTGPSPALASAVQYALRKNVVIVAGAGNHDKETGEPGPAFPANYQGVISVGSLGEDGSRLDTSSQFTKVDVGAPGRGVYTAWAKSTYHPSAEGTSYAAAYVSGVAALVRSAHPQLNARQVIHRVIATADGTVGTGTGRGMVNPTEAVAAVLPEEAAGPRPSPQAGKIQLAGREPEDERAQTIGMIVTASAIGLALLAAVTGVVLPLGRRRNWRPGRRVIVAPQAEIDEDDLGQLDRARIGGSGK
jgi:membrane-anchored mycosin MYCP